MRHCTIARRMFVLTAWLAGAASLPAVEPREVVTGEHKGRNAQSVAVSPDGRLVAAAYGGRHQDQQRGVKDKGGIAVWKIDMGRQVSFAHEYADLVTLEFTADSRSVIYCRILRGEGGDYNLIRLVEAATGEKSQLWRDGWNRRFVAAASPTADQLLVTDGASGLGRIVSKRLWLDLPTNLTFEQWDQLRGARKLKLAQEGGPRAAAFSPDGAALAMYHTLLEGSTYVPVHLTVWDADSLEVRGRIESQDLLGCTSVTLAPGGTLAATGHREGVVRIWSIEDEKLLHTISLPVAGCARPLFAPDGKELAVLTQWAVYPSGSDPLPRRRRWRFADKPDSFDFDDDRPAAEADVVFYETENFRPVRHWRFADGKFAHWNSNARLVTHMPLSNPQRIAYTPDGERLLIGAGGVSLIDIATARVVEQFAAP